MTTQAALVRKLRTEWPVGPGNRVACRIMSEAADVIEKLERDLAHKNALLKHLMAQCEATDNELAAEKALADQAVAFIGKVLVGPAFADEAVAIETAYRKARGL